MKRLSSILLMTIVTGLAQAHEFWLQPKKYRYQVGEQVKVDFMVGENFTGEYWDLKRHKAEKVELHRASGVKDITAEVNPTKGENISFIADQLVSRHA